MSAVLTPVLWRNARLLPCDGQSNRLDSAAMITRGNRFDWVGRERDLPAALREECAESQHVMAKRVEEVWKTD